MALSLQLLQAMNATLSLAILHAISTENMQSLILQWNPLITTTNVQKNQVKHSNLGNSTELSKTLEVENEFPINVQGLLNVCSF